LPLELKSNATKTRFLAPPPAVPELSPAAVSQGLSGGRLVRRVSPTYPAQAVLLRLEGEVILNAVIFEDGTVHDLKVVEGHPVLARTTPGLILFYSSSRFIAVTWRVGGLVTWLLATGRSSFFNPSERFRTRPPLRILF
jgi:hypothetical protein